MIKHRIRNAETKEILAYEWVDENGHWKWRRPNTLGPQLFNYGIYDINSLIPIIRERYTGLIVKDEKELYEGDPVQFPDYLRKEMVKAHIKYEAAGWWFWGIEAKEKGVTHKSFESFFTGNHPLIPAGDPKSIKIIDHQTAKQ